MSNSNEYYLADTRELLQKSIDQSKVDPVFFIDRFCYTFDPKHEPYHLPFRLFDFQKDLVVDIQHAINNGYDLFIEKCREMGATYTVLDVFLWFWLYIPGSNFLVGSRKESYVDSRQGNSTGMSNKEDSLYGKLEYTLNRLPNFILPKNFDIKKHMTYMNLRNPENGNIIRGESSNSNFSRGGREKAILLDEFAFWDNATSAWGATADTTNCRVALTTPGIKPGKAKRLRFGKDGEKIKVITLNHYLDPRKTAEWLDRERQRRSKEDLAREVMMNWEASITGIMYPEIQYASVGVYPFYSAWPLYRSWDFGIDGTAIQWWQPNFQNGKMRLIDSYYNEGHPIQFYFPFVGEPIDSMYVYSQEDLEAIEALRNLSRAINFGDPDVSKRSFTSKVMTSARKELQKINIHVQTKPEANDNQTRQEVTKVMLQTGIEINNTIRNDFWLEAIRNARIPNRAEDSESTSANITPIHDWSSHHRTATEYFAVNYEIKIKQYAVENDTNEDPYDL